MTMHKYMIDIIKDNRNKIMAYVAENKKDVAVSGLIVTDSGEIDSPEAQQMYIDDYRVLLFDFENGIVDEYIHEVRGAYNKQTAEYIAPLLPEETAKSMFAELADENDPDYISDIVIGYATDAWEQILPDAAAYYLSPEAVGEYLDSLTVENIKLYSPYKYTF